jgi:hypothetical protein
VARSPDHATFLTEGLPYFQERRPSVSGVAWSGDHATTEDLATTEMIEK